MASLVNFTKHLKNYYQSFSNSFKKLKKREHFQIHFTEHYPDTKAAQEHYRKRKSQANTEKAMAPHSSTLAWKIPWMEEPGRLQSMGSLWVGHDWATSLSLSTFLHWRRKWKPTPVFLPGESQGRGNLAGFCLWGRTESDTTEAT